VPDVDQSDDEDRHRNLTRDAYDRLAPVWSATTDLGPFNGWLERPAVRSLVPRPLTGARVLEAACGAGAQCEWLIGLGAEVVGVDLSPAMIEETRRRCQGRGRFLVADLAEPLDLEPGSFDGVTCSLALHYLRDWRVPLASFADALRPGGWAVLSLEHPFGPPLAGQRGGYFDTELVSDTWVKGNVEVTQSFWRRPLYQVVGAFAEAGLLIEEIVEPQPSKEALLQYPDELGQVVGVPIFIAYRLRKVVADQLDTLHS
jgi:SAM-dependent methyltransferase